MNALRYYRCTGADGYRFSGKALCNNGPVRSDQLEQVVWDQVRALLEEPSLSGMDHDGRAGLLDDGRPGETHPRFEPRRIENDREVLPSVE